MKEVYRLNQHSIREGYPYRNCWTWPSEKRYLRKSGKGDFVSLAKNKLLVQK